MHLHQRTRSPRPSLRAAWLTALLAGAALTAAPLSGQAVQFAGFQSTVGASSLNQPQGVAVDAAGDVFIADWGEGHVSSRLLKVAPDGTQTTLSINFVVPRGVAVDGAGDVFVADPAGNFVWKLAPDGTQTPVGSNLNGPTGVAVDGAGNVFIANTYNVLAVARNGMQSGMAGVNLSQPTGVAVDGAGDLFIADVGNNRVLKQRMSNISPIGPLATVVSSGLSNPGGVAVDGAGDVFIADWGHNRVVQVTPNGTQTTVGSGLNGPAGVAVDVAGDVFIADAGNQRVLKVQTTAAQFGRVNVCPAGQSSPAPCSQSLTLTYNVTEAGTLGTPQMLTDGVPNRDFTLAGSTCSGTLTTGASCTVKVILTPQVAGLRRGAVQMVDTSGNVLATTFLQGLGVGPEVALGPGTQTTLLGSGLQNPYGVAVDAAGNVLLADTDNNRVLKLAPNGTQTPVGSGLHDPTGAAVDGAGDVIIADSANNRVLKVAPNGTQTVVVGSGLNGPTGVAADGAGNVFVADRDNSRVLKVAPNGIQSTVGSGLQNPYGVAVDGVGDVIIADTMHNRVLKIAPDGTQTQVGYGFDYCTGVAVDAAGDVFIADQGNNRVVEVAADGTQTTVGSGLSVASGVAVDGVGNLFLADRGNNRVVKVARAQPFALSFAVTPVGSPSADSPQSLTVENIGNAPLASLAPGLTVSANFAQVPGSGTPADCTAKFALTPGGSCNLSLIFNPTQVGTLTGSAVLYDSSWNFNPALQYIALQGVGR